MRHQRRHARGWKEARFRHRIHIGRPQLAGGRRPGPALRGQHLRRLHNLIRNQKRGRCPKGDFSRLQFVLLFNFNAKLWPSNHIQNHLELKRGGCNEDL